MKQIPPRDALLQRTQAPFEKPWDSCETLVVYRDEQYTLGQEEGRPYLITDGKRYALSCHPYEPCLYITDEAGRLTAVHNAFEPFSVLEAFYNGRTVTSITGFVYDAAAFCRMVAYAAGRVDLSIDAAERPFRSAAQKAPAKTPGAQVPAKAEKARKNPPETAPAGDDLSVWCPDDPFYAVLESYPDRVIDCCLVRHEHRAQGVDAHRMALVRACQKLLAGDEEDEGWHYNVDTAEARRLDPAALFAPAVPDGALNYRKAFLYPPHGAGYAAADFDKLNTALFPDGTDHLEAYEWTTDWSDYFDDGHEWWGALCLTVYDKSRDRFAVILASATD